jgi:hypothetical protein
MFIGTNIVGEDNFGGCVTKQLEGSRNSRQNRHDLIVRFGRCQCHRPDFTVLIGSRLDQGKC